MKKFSIVALVLLTSCSTLQKDSAELKKIGHDLVDDSIDEINTTNK